MTRKDFILLALQFGKRLGTCKPDEYKPIFDSFGEISVTLKRTYPLFNYDRFWNAVRLEERYQKHRRQQLLTLEEEQRIAEYDKRNPR